MKTNRFSFYLLALPVAAVFGGCATEKIMADYTIPARKVLNVKDVNVVSIQANAKVAGSQVKEGDSTAAAGLMRNFIAMRLYKEGYYGVADNVWGNIDGIAKLQAALKAKDAGHGYASFATDQNVDKVILDLDLDVTVDSQKVTKERTFSLVTVPYKKEAVKAGEAPTSKPDKPVISEVKQSYEVYETTVKGTLKAAFAGKNGGQSPVAYANTFTVKMPADKALDSSSPSILKAIATAVSPALDEVIKDISPSKESRTFEANKDGDEKVVLLLNAKAFSEVISTVDAMKAPNYADYENQGLAYEATGDFSGAKTAYQAALKLRNDAAFALAGVKRIQDIMEAKKTVKASGAQQDKSTAFKK